MLIKNPSGLHPMNPLVCAPSFAWRNVARLRKTSKNTAHS